MITIKKPLWLKLITRIGLPIILIYILILIYNYNVNKQNALNSTKAYLIELTKYRAEELNKEFVEISKSASSLKNLIESSENIKEEEIFRFAARELEQDHDNIATGVAFLPEQSRFYDGYLANLIHKKNDTYVISDLTKRYDYINEDWFAIARHLDRGYWAEPFWGKVSKDLLMVYSIPIKDNGEFIGVTYADISLKILSTLMKEVNILDGYPFIISNNGTFIYHPDKSYVMTESIFSLAEQFNNPELRQLGRKMIKGESEVSYYNDVNNNQKRWIVYTPIESTGWSFAAVIPEETILEQVKKTLIKQVWMFIAALIIILGLIMIIARKVSEPLKKLAIATNDIAEGKLDIKIDDLSSKDEIAVLGHSFNSMTDKLKLHIRNLTNMTKAKEAVDSEMRIARSIQESLLPRIFPAFPERKEFDLFARNIAAKEVAGDFYDFFFINDNIMAVIIADVSGKGISAGLFMAVTRTLLKTVCSVDQTPAEALTKANKILSEDNDACMFTTLFLGFYNVNTGKLSYSNAGHDYPILMETDGNCTIVETQQDIALGIDEDHIYNNGSLVLEANQTLILYTDGVIEATNKDDVLFGESSFITLLSKNHRKSLPELMDSVTTELSHFQGENQFDDITLLFLKRFNR